MIKIDKKWFTKQKKENTSDSVEQLWEINCAANRLKPEI